MSELDPLQVLEDELTEAITAHTGLRSELAREYARPMLAYLQARYGGDKLYIPAIRRRYDPQEIRQFMADHCDPGKAMERFNVSRSTLYRILRQDEQDAA